MKKISAVIFDWDGTLAHTRPLVVAALNRTLSYYDLPDWDHTKQKKRAPDKSLKENFPHFFGDRAAEAYERYLLNYHDSFQSLETYDGVTDTLEYFSSTETPLHIVSNKEKSLLTREVDYLFPHVKFGDISGNGDAAQNKPNPAPILRIAERIGLNLKEDLVLLVGDSKQDTECAYAAGCMPVLIGTGKFMDKSYIREKKRSTPSLLTFNGFKDFLSWAKQKGLPI